MPSQTDPDFLFSRTLLSVCVCTHACTYYMFVRTYIYVASVLLLPQEDFPESLATTDLGCFRDDRGDRVLAQGLLGQSHMSPEVRYVLLRMSVLAGSHTQISTFQFGVYLCTPHTHFFCFRI